MNWMDAISAADLDGGEYIPTYGCETCGEALPPGEMDECATCERERQQFEANRDDPRRSSESEEQRRA